MRIITSGKSESVKKRIRKREKMLIQSQDKNLVINFDNFHELFVDEVGIYARYFCLDKKISVCLGRYDTPEAAQKEFESLQEALTDENGNLDNTIIEVE